MVHVGLRRWPARIIREPFFQFMALGLLIWWVLASVESSNRRYVIQISRAQLERLAAAYEQQSTQAPTAEELQQLVGRYITEEILFREGLALHLDRDDEIVRRRIAQKFQFLQTDLAVVPPPSPQALSQWFERHQDRYLGPARASFTQVYFSPDRDSDERARVRAQHTLPRLKQSGAQRAPTLGDAFPGPSDADSIDPDAAERLFGNSQLSQALFTAPVGQWFGPVRSGYGWHLIYVTQRKAPETAHLDDIRNRVEADYLEEQRANLNARGFEQLRAKYRVVRDDSLP